MALHPPAAAGPAGQPPCWDCGGSSCCVWGVDIDRFGWSVRGDGGVWMEVGLHGAVVAVAEPLEIGEAGCS